MVSEIIKAISVTLNRVFGDDFEVYFSKDVQQGLKEPCFIIALMGSSRIRRIDHRYQQLNSFDLQYFPSEKYGNAEMIGVAEELFDALELIKLNDDDLVHGTNLNYSIMDGVLHFFLDVNMFLKKELELDPMETVSVNANTTREG